MTIETLPLTRPAPQAPGARPRTMWSNSSLNTLQQCGIKYEFRYIKKVKVPPTARMMRGTVVHRIAQGSYERKRATATLPSLEEVRDLAATEFDKQWPGVQLARDEAAEGTDAVQARSKDFAVSLSGVHVERVAPGITPVAVERKIVVQPRDANISIEGTLDLVAAGPAGEVIRDLKTTERRPAADTADTSPQLTMYALIRMAETGTLPAELTLDYLIRTPARGETTYLPMTTTRDAVDLRTLVLRINAGIGYVEAGKFMPAPVGAWYCSEQWCEYWDQCPYVQRGLRRPAA